MRNTKVKNLTMLGFFSAIAVILSLLESSLIVLPALPGVKVGLANVVVMFILFTHGRKNAVYIVILKGIFSLITRGAMAGVLSLAGGLLSIIVIILLGAVIKRASLSLLSVGGAVTHNLAQFSIVSVVYYPASMLYYLPFLVISGVIFGIVSSVFLKAVTPSLSKMWEGVK